MNKSCILPRRRAFLSLLLLPLLFCATQINHAGGSSKGKWKVLFDGASTDAWRGYMREGFPARSWTIDNGALKTIPNVTAQDRCDLITKDVYRDFELELEWRVAPSGNSGVIYFVSEGPQQTWQSGFEMQVLDDAKHHDGQNPKTSAGALYALIAPTNKTLRPVGEYNTARLVVQNGHVEHWLNGQRVVAYQLGTPELKALIAHSKFNAYPTFAQTSAGHIALQNHGEEAWFRNIRIRALPSK